MPTATLTTKTTTSNSPTIIPLKADKPSQANETTTVATLRSLYNRAARAFLHRDVTQTHSLLTSAFSIMQSPSSYAADSLATHRRKWDILRITLETTVYASPTYNEAMPSALRDKLTLSSQTLISTLHQRSLVLFTPTSHTQKPSSVFLPSQVLITLVLSSMKLDCPISGRSIIEDWLASRGQFGELQEDGEGYEKVLDMYCLHVLPRLEEWDYAKEFLQHESELPQEKRARVISSLQALYSETMEACRPPSPPRTPTPTPTNPNPSSPRSISPAPSASSSSSSLSTTSTHTAVPRTPRQNALIPRSMSGLIPATSSVSVASDVTVTKRRSSPPRTRHTSNSNSAKANGSATVPTSVSSSSIFRPPRLEPTSASARPPGTLALIRASLGPYLTSSRLTTFLLLFVLLPFVSLVLRIRRQRRTVAAGAGLGAAEVVRRRLANGQGQTTIGRIWEEVVKSVSDTIRMGGGGLV